jgi:hypothetical protein
MRVRLHRVGFVFVQRGIRRCAQFVFVQCGIRMWSGTLLSRLCGFDCTWCAGGVGGERPGFDRIFLRPTSWETRRVSGFGFRVVQRARRVRLPGLLTTIVYPTLFAGTSGVREVINVDGFGLGNSGSEFRAGLVFWGYNPV